jgi:KDO2-lipid IV(A) lauroyltransferase
MLSVFAYLQYLLLRIFSFVINLLGEGVALRMGRQFGRAAFLLDRDHRNVALDNLHTAFGREKSEEELKGIARKTFQNLGMMAIEFFRMDRMSIADYQSRVEVQGLDRALDLLKMKKGVLLLASHFGNWEMMGFMSKVIGHPITVIAKPVKKNRWVDHWITGLRERAGLVVIAPQQAARKAIRALSENRAVGVLIDQRAKRTEGVWADFFGKKAPTTPGLAVMALRSGAPVLPVFMVRDGDRGHRLLIQEPLELIRTGDLKKDVEANTVLFNQVLESMIRRYPDQWFWVHRRWERKAKPKRRVS